MADIHTNLPDGLKQIRDKFGDAVKIVGINQDRNSEFIDKFDDVIKMLSLGSQEQILGRLVKENPERLRLRKNQPGMLQSGPRAVWILKVFSPKKSIPSKG